MFEGEINITKIKYICGENEMFDGLERTLKSAMSMFGPH